MTELQKLLVDLKKYKTTNTEFHAGDVLEHSIWSALYANHLFATGDRRVQDINPKLRDTIVITCLLHDIGKGGDEQYRFFDKPSHPEIGGHYFEMGQYPNPPINLRKIIEELNQAKYYKLITFLVRWHWAIGDTLREGKPEEQAWKLYFEFNLACERDKIPYEKRMQVFACLWVVWECDLLATQRYPYNIDPGMPINLLNPSAPHSGSNMYEKLRIAEKFPIRQQVMAIFQQGYERPDFAKGQIEIFRSNIGKLGDKYYKIPTSGNPFLWTETIPEKAPRPYRETAMMEENQEKCLEFLKNSDPKEIPLFAGFPEMANLPKEKLAEMYAVACTSSAKYICPMLRPVPENFSEKEIINMPSGTLLYHGRGYRFCEPPNVNPSRALWLFKDKKDVYTYATGRGEDSQYPAKDFCWNILTYETIGKLRLLNLSESSVREKLRDILKKFPCDSWYSKEGIMDYIDKGLPTYSDVLDYMFPKDVLSPEEKTERVSHTTADLNMASTLEKIFPNIDGWYIGDMNPMLPEIAIFKPYDKVKLKKHEYFDGQRMEGLLSRCMKKKDKDICVKELTKLFKNVAIVCLDYGKGKPVECYLPEELLNSAIVTKEQYNKILSELDKGNAIVKIF